MVGKVTERMIEIGLNMAKEAKDIQTLRMATSILLPKIAGLSLEDTSKCLGIGKRTVSHLRKKFIDLLSQTKQAMGDSSSNSWGGRRKSYLPATEEIDFMRELEERAKEGGFVYITTIKKEFESKIGKIVHKTTIYRLLERYNWRKIAPRRYHPKRDLTQQEAFKKTFLI